jgi:hypothetical protein
VAPLTAATTEPAALAGTSPLQESAHLNSVQRESKLRVTHCRNLPQEIALNRAVLRVPVTAASSAGALSPAELPAIHGDHGRNRGTEG